MRGGPWSEAARQTGRLTLGSVGHAAAAARASRKGVSKRNVEARERGDMGGLYRTRPGGPLTRCVRARALERATQARQTRARWVLSGTKSPRACASAVTSIQKSISASYWVAAFWSATATLGSRWEADGCASRAR